MRPFIIAEIGSNFSGINDCLVSIEKAAKTGADAVKFQLFDHEGLYGFKSNKERSPIGHLKSEWLSILKRCSDINNIEFMCTAFSPEQILTVDPFVKRHKLASAEMMHLHMLDVLRDTGKPLYISTGGHSINEIRETLKYYCGDSQDFDGCLLYCVSAYPAHEYYLKQIKNYRDIFDVETGYSDHTLSPITPLIAIAYGATVIEKHANFVGIVSPDSPHSLTGSQFKSLMDSIPFVTEIKDSPLKSETPMVTTYNRRLIATQDIKNGETLSEGKNFGSYRSTQASEISLSPFKTDLVDNKMVNKDISQGSSIVDSDLVD